MTGNDIRRQFLEYFKQHGHHIARSSSLIPSDDPTLLFTNAGMVQFKRVFLGEEKRNWQTAATSQKCVRAGGKHNDLENVGYTARHHTFFEMLGNFSFGDYFKERAIEYSWDLLVNRYKLPEDKLWVSVYLDDDDAYNIWRKNIGVPENRIVRLGEEDNFWSMGDTGPCGPCSEILLDRGADFGCKKPECKVGCECDRYLEIWNLVFMQFNRDSLGNLTPLPKPSIDTGMGLERIVSVIQNTPTNYETDLIMPIIKKIEALSEKQYGDSPKADICMKVIADHVRASVFLIGDGALPSNEMRGYVLRRIMRRAIRYGRGIGLKGTFLHEIAKIVFDIMKPAYPELFDASAFITNVIKNEEIRFSETLDNGLRLLNDTLLNMKAKGQKTVQGSVIFKLYDTYGFPVDIVKDVTRENDMLLDMEGFDKSMEKQRTQSKSVKTFSKISDAYKNLSSKGIKSKFVGYDKDLCDSKVLVMIENDDFTVELVTEATPFYSESGGQIGDVGRITGRNFDMEVLDTIKDPTGIVIHQGKIISGTIKKGEMVSLAININKRRAMECSHTTAHILHSVLREILGDHVKQAGSLVSPDRLRFDFNHFSQIDAKTLDEIEILVNKKICENIAVQTEEMDADKAFKSGATALFEEKYGDRVRVVSLGSFSKELCGGTHTSRTGNIGLFKITAESSAAAGIRRIVAFTGMSALKYVQKMSAIAHNTANLIKEKPESVIKRIEKILSDYKSLEKKIAHLQASITAKSALTNLDIKFINGVNVIVKKVSVDKPSSLRELADKLKNKIKSGVVVLGSVVGSKALLITLVTKDLTDRFNAGDIVKQTASIVGGGGGGRADMAQAGGTMPDKLDEALKKVYELVGNSTQK